MLTLQILNQLLFCEEGIAFLGSVAGRLSSIVSRHLLNSESDTLKNNLLGLLITAVAIEDLGRALASYELCIALKTMILNPSEEIQQACIATLTKLCEMHEELLEQLSQDDTLGKFSFL